MKVMKLTDSQGNEYYNADYCPGLVGETVKRLNNTCKVEMLEMTEQEYYSIPATNASAKLWE